MGSYVLYVVAIVIGMVILVKMIPPII
jgi:hypothetical protein